MLQLYLLPDGPSIAKLEATCANARESYHQALAAWAAAFESTCGQDGAERDKAYALYHQTGAVVSKTFKKLEKANAALQAYKDRAKRFKP